MASLDPTTLYRLLQLRVDVFVVEQTCPYPELDGRDLEPAALQWWVEADGVPVATLRLLREADALVIGRVATAASHRGQGLAAELMAAVLAEVGAEPVRLSAQAHLEHWYARFGFEVSGPGYLEDGIPHVPMYRAGR